MSEKKVYYWMKLKEQFMNSEEIDYLMSQKDGANYVVIYEMLVLSVSNKDGKLQTQIGELIVPYTLDKICRECKWFSVDTIKVALTLFAQLGLMFKDENGILEISGFNNFVGHETNYAEQKRLQRERKNEIESHDDNEVDSEVDNVHFPLNSLSLNSLSSNDSNESNNSSNVKKKEVPISKRIPPNIEDVIEYCNKRNNGIDGNRFWNYYNQMGWKLSNGQKMKDWHSAIVTWETRSGFNYSEQKEKQFESYRSDRE